MIYRNLGKSGLQVSLFSLGSWLTFGKQITDQTADELMSIAYEQGINFFDNAEGYVYGKSEEVMGRILKSKNWDRSSYVVSSKVFFGVHRDAKPNQTGLSRKHIVEACHAALKRLQVDYLDMYFCHRPDPTTPILETVWAMNHLLQQGKILYWGTSEWSATEIEEAHQVAKKYLLIGPSMEQPQYNLFVRERFEKEYAPLYKNYGMGTTIWSPLSSGLLSGKHSNDAESRSRLAMKGLEWLRDKNLTAERLQKVEQLKTIATGLQLSLPQLALAWCAKNKNVSTVILGASKSSQLLENLETINQLDKLSDDAMNKIETVVNNHPAE
jgi:voltage-dependent potassium channel beta subunit